MKSLRLHAARDLRLHDEPDPIPGRDEDLVRVTAVGLCGSDLHWYENGGIGDAHVVTPLVLGHEMGGVIAAGPRAGTRVALDPARPCERCPSCLAGHGNLCPDVRFAGHGPMDGALRTLMAWPTRLMVPVPEAIPDHVVPLLEPLGIAIHSAELAHVRPGMSAGVYGAGPIGLVLIRYLRAIGVAPILATDRLPHRVEAAIDSGATEARLAGADGRPPGLSAWGPVDVTFDAAGDDDALATAFETVRIGGRVVIVGIPGNDRTAFAAATPRRKGLTIVLARRMRGHHLARATELVALGHVDPAPLVSARFPLTEASRAFDELVARRGLKIVVEPQAALAAS
jgi:L-iditol 2-dehydrogenase